MGPKFVTTHRPTQPEAITNPPGPKLVKNTDQGGAKSGDHTHTLDEQLSMRWRNSKNRSGPGSRSHTTRSIQRWPNNSIAARTCPVDGIGFRRERHSIWL